MARVTFNLTTYFWEKSVQQQAPAFVSSWRVEPISSALLNDKLDLFDSDSGIRH